MPIRGHDKIQLKSAIPCFTKVSAQVLDESIVCVDGFWFLKKYGNIANIQNLFIEKCEEMYVSPVLQLIKLANTHNFQILWVWDGLDFNKGNESHVDELEILKAGFEFYKQNDTKALRQCWLQMVDYEEVIQYVNNLLTQFNHGFVRAPYSATAQIAYYLRNDICSYAFCKTDATIFDGIIKVVSDIYFEDSTIAIYNKIEFMKGIDINYTQYKTLAFALGCEYCPTVPEYADNFIFENIVNSVKTREINKFIKERNWQKQMHRAYIIVDFHPVMAESGKVVFYNDLNHISADFKDVFGLRLPDLLYSNFFCCKISKGILSNLNNKNCNLIRKLCKRVLKTKINFRNMDDAITGNLEEILCENINMLDYYFDKKIQILIYFLLKQNLLNKNSTEKLISLIDLNYYTLQTKVMKSVSFDFDLLKFVYFARKQLRYFNELIECYQLVSEKEIEFKFKIWPLLSNVMNFRDCKDNKILFNYSNEYLKKMKRFIEINEHSRI